ncbi:NADH oxidoreductase Hcr [Cricetibacter osteomyelitidis]|uniref:NADH oxidoreductase Hcr n=1 Tax=Cricetibacter osteomyelitidis TaxID=1521931 RepID=A0A4R2TJV6_9PAST|nr:NADH oxidoreductase [Cricetibacter osteomyelitidis]TCP95122.1 NADH oxidoreductase Hcr [Cricetibacter osteomyelitidis]
MANNNPICTHEMMVHSIVQETKDVVTVNLIAHDFYPYQPGQYAMLSIKNTYNIARAYTLSSTPGMSEFVTITVRHIENGVGSTWINKELKVGDIVWLSEPMGDFTCSKIQSDNYLLVGAGSGITPIISMARHLLAKYPDMPLTVIYSVHSPKDIIFKNEWERLRVQHPQLKLIINASVNALDGFIAGRISEGMLRHFVPDLADKTVLVCGPESYIETLKEIADNAGVPQDKFFVEQFFGTAVASEIDPDKKATLSIRGASIQEFEVPVGMTLLAALEENKQPIVAACRSGICGTCKTIVLDKSGLEVKNNGSLTEDEIAAGYVLACSCRIRDNVEVVAEA